MKTDRRKLLLAGAGVLGGAAVAAGIGWWYRARAPHAGMAMPGMGEFPNALRLPGASGMMGLLEVSGPLSIAAKPVQHAILDGKPAPLLAYHVERDGQSWINPVFRVRRGATFSARLLNALDESTIIHWHGLKLDAANDAHPRYAIAAGAAYDYRFSVPNRAGTYWYHPHPHGLTARQTYLGMASLFVVEDDEELALARALDLKLGVTDLPLVIQDRKLDAEGRLAYAPSDEESVNGVLGDTVLVNLTPRPHFNAATRLYRFRILNASNARVYRLAFAQDSRRLEYAVIGTDGGLLERPYAVKEAFLSPGERLEVLLDLRGAALGDAIILQSLGFDPMHAEGAMAMDSGATGAQGEAPSPHAGMAMGGPAPGASPGAALSDGAAIDLLRINVTGKIAYEPSVPAALSALAPAVAPQVKPREFALDLKDRRWRINGDTFEMTQTPLEVKRGASEIWELRNNERSMPHPMHLHGFPFRVLARTGSPRQVKPAVVNRQGLTAADLGWKDNVLVWPGETVRLAVDFSHPYPGDQVHLLHCHNLEHEDQGMMINVRVRG